MRLPVSGARLRRAGVPIADLVAGGGRLGDDFQGGLGARLGLPRRPVSQEGDAMFVASSRILLGRMGAGMSSWWRKGASGCLPDRRCQAAEASLSLEFTLSFCPGLCLLVQGCARDGRPTPPRGRNASWNGNFAKHCAARRRQCCTTCKPAPRHEGAAIGRRPSRPTTVVAVEAAIRHR